MDEIRYQVFVSSTFTDLKDEREKVLQAILQLRAFPAGMELFPAADEEQFEFIKREIESSDYYIVIIAGRYGSLAEDGLSFTEKEYDYARSIGKPVLAFIVKDLGKLIGEKIELLEEPRKQLEAFTEKAKKSKLVRFYSNPDELKSEVLHSLPSQFNLKPMRGWVRAGQTPREDLVKINDLQQRVLKLEAENGELRASQANNSHALASGEDIVAWDVDITDFAFSSKYPTVRQIHLESTWNKMMRVVFTGSSSNVTEHELHKRLLTWILSQLDPGVGSSEWFALASDYVQKWKVFGHHSALELVVSSLQLQFSGLGFISDALQTVQVPQDYGPALAKSMRVWSLTRQGALQLALAYGKSASSQ